MKNICLVGAGSIADVHAEALSALKGLQISCIVDVRDRAAAALARKWKVSRSFSSVAAALAEAPIDAAHVLVPPDRHRDVALAFIEARIPVLIEKPLAASAEEARQLVERARALNVPIGVNQNFVFHPAFAAIQAQIHSGCLGRLRSVDCLYSMPLRQIAAGQFGHWMFRQPKNILLEQAVHPLSQITVLAGRASKISGVAGPSREISPGIDFFPACDLLLWCEHAAVHLRFAVGESYPAYLLVATCDDGVAVADMVSNRIQVHTRSRWLDVADQAVGGLRVGRQLAAASVRNVAGYGLSMLKVRPRSDAFYLSMKKSIAAFHNVEEGGEGNLGTASPRSARLDGEFGAYLVSLCESVARDVLKVGERPVSPPAAAAAEDYEIAVFGGTGFVGGHLVTRLIREGRRIGVIARNTSNLAPLFYDAKVSLVQADVTSADDVRRAIGRAKIVVNLAHGGGGSSWAEIERVMVGSARAVAEACGEKGVERLVHVGSIASLFLGDPRSVITDAAPPDAKDGLRGDYARAKAAVDRLLLQMHRERGLPVCILRPGIVLGQGGTPFHSGFGFYNNDQHCLGWNAGRNPLPLVLVEDVAEAIHKAIETPLLEGQCFNLVGDVRLTAREYVAELTKATGRPLRFHGQWTTKLYLIELMKWVIKQAAGKRGPRTTLYDLRSRGMTSRFDCSASQEKLRWRPQQDRSEFVKRAIEVHAARGMAEGS
ncbi:MAG: NAD-dependent epimerase/dehydratase family protein [Rhodoplanes sp.]